MSPEAITWLNQFADRPLNDPQRLALVYLRHNERMTNGDYQRLNHVDSVTANRELRGLVQSELIEQHSTRRWAYYTLNVPALAEIPTPPTDEERILQFVRDRGSISNAECRDLLHVSLQRASHLLKKMRMRGLLRREGERRWARYYLP
jgi:predicted HTH transcriptional regulator